MKRRRNKIKSINEKGKSHKETVTEDKKFGRFMERKKKGRREPENPSESVKT